MATQRTRSRCTPYTEPYPDELSACLWHLDADTDYRFLGADPAFDINLGNVWDTTMGAGVTVAVVDHAWEATHEDIRDNTVGGRGVAPRATLVNHNFLDSPSKAAEVTAMTLNKETVAVYNLSYGTPDSYYPTSSGHLWRQAVDEGLHWGFGGKGSSYVKAAGNGALSAGSDWASLEESNNHRGIITVCALDADGESASYSEDGASLWACAPGGDLYPEPRILAPIGNNGYADAIVGTSASAPMVSGVIALMRSVNADLTWRDVKVILANTAQKNHASHSSWMTGAAKYGSDTERYSFSYEYGFGAVDARAAVAAASSWALLAPEYTGCEAGTCGLRGTFRFGSSRHLGENPSGTWRLKVRRYAPDVVGCNSSGNGTGAVQSSRCQRISSFSETITSWKISVAGHTSSTTQPVTLSVTPSTVTEGGDAEIDVRDWGGRVV
ncbi:MAG: S8 family serine peptidase [Acidimicrobiaceae bacterium]|nr:S8 family serine peptidase [Acidimicrobiaceae bacterium]MDE0497508.1 S8 family serine peptidase [Acidimicrobiaceae bacterium]